MEPEQGIHRGRIGVSNPERVGEGLGSGQRGAAGRVAVSPRFDPGSGLPEWVNLNKSFQLSKGQLPSPQN